METAALVLTPLRPEDAGEVFSVTSSPAVARFMRFDTHTRREEAAALIEEYTAGSNRGFALRRRTDGRFVGVFALKAGETPGVYTISVFLGEAHWGHGYFTQLLGRMIPYAREVLQASVLQAYVVGENLSSRRVLEDSGFSVAEILRFDGLSDGLYIYRLAL